MTDDDATPPVGFGGKRHISDELWAAAIEELRLHPSKPAPWAIEAIRDGGAEVQDGEPA